MKTHQITGVGPQAPDGSVELFTILPRPFRVTKQWIEQYAAYPSVDDSLTEADDGTLTLVSEPVESSLQLAGVSNAPEAQKKTSAEGSENGSPDGETLKIYVANPVEVVAGKITHVGEAEPDESRHLLLEDNSVVVASGPMLARMLPSVGDYWIMQADGYEYLNPKDVFERKYSLKQQ